MAKSGFRPRANRHSCPRGVPSRASRFYAWGMPSLVGCLLFFSCLGASAGQGRGDALDLGAGHPVSVLLTPDHDATLRVRLSGTQAEEIVLDAAVPDISYRI